jgi:hypothetical protein
MASRVESEVVKPKFAIMFRRKGLSHFRLRSWRKYMVSPKVPAARITVNKAPSALRFSNTLPMLDKASMIKIKLMSAENTSSIQRVSTHIVALPSKRARGIINNT